jgi:tetratricopeptide (TPR) repeat protein
VHRNIQTALLLPFLIACPITTSIWAAEIRVKDKVVALREIDITQDEIAVDRAHAGFPMDVEELKPGYVRVSGLKKSGWLKAEDIVAVADAIPYFFARIEKDPSDWEALRARATLLRYDDKLLPAEADFDAALRLNLQDARSWEGRGYLRLLRKDYTGAIRDFSEWRLLELDDPRPPMGRTMARLAQAELANISHKAGEMHFALRNLPDEDSRTHPLRPADYEDALHDLATVLQIKPDFCGTYMTRCQLYTNQGDYEHAIADVTECIRLEPKLAYSYQVRGRLWIKKKDYPHALADFDESLRLKPNEAQTYRWRGLVGLESNNLDQGIADLSKAILLDPKCPNPYVKRGAAYVRKNEFHKALVDFDQAIALDPNVAAPWFNRANAWIKLKENEKAMLDLNEGIRLEPKNAEQICVRGALYDELGKKSEAIDDLRVAVRLNPNEFRYASALAFLLASQPKASRAERDEALAFAQLACKLTDEKNLACLEILASVYAERGEFAQAVEWQKRAVDASTTKEGKAHFEKVLLAFQRKRTHWENPLRFR